MAKLYDAGNVNCSPYEPAMGHNVIYRTSRLGRAESEKFPGIIVNALKGADGGPDEFDRVDLIVFTSTGPRHINRVKFSSDDESENTWAWVPDRVEREPIQQAKPEFPAKKNPSKPEPKSVHGHTGPVSPVRAG